MKDFSLKTQIYILTTLAAGIALVGFSLSQLIALTDWMITLLLAVLGSLSLILKVEGTTNRTHYHISFVIYAYSLLYLGAPEAIFVIVVSHLVEWAWHRYPWYIQGFNVCMYVVVAAISEWLYTAINPGQVLDSWAGITGIVAALACFTLLNHLMVGIIVWLARGENLAKSGVFTLFSLAMDFIMLCIGANAALMMTAHPMGLLLALLPLYLIYSTLRVPSLERKSETDPKTGLFNLPYFEASLKNELRRAERFDRPLSVVMADLDFLRTINNTYGHLAGDEVLVGVANILRSSVRDFDVVARFGGEEFALLLPEATPEEAFERVEAIRTAIEQHDFVIPTSVTPIKATMSFGIAGRVPGCEGREIVQNADSALYHSKLTGRNRTYIYSDEGYKSLFQGEPPAASEAMPAPGIFLNSPANSTPPPETPPTPPRPPMRPVSAEPATRPIHKGKETGASNCPVSKQTLSRSTLAFMSVLAILAFGLLAYSLLSVDKIEWLGIAIFALLAAMTEATSVEIYIRDTSVSISAVPLLAGTLLFGPVGAAAMSLAVSLVALIKHHSPFNRFVFNLSNHLLATLTALVLVNHTGVHYHDMPVIVQILVTAFIALYIFIATSFYISLALHFSQKGPAMTIWKEQFAWLTPYYLVMGLTAYTLVYSYQQSGAAGISAILVPLFLLRFSQKQFVDRTREAVSELHDKNGILEENAREINRLNDGLLETLAEVIDLRDPYVLGHSRQVTYYAVMIAQHMGLPASQVEQIRRGSLMHDVGKLGIHQSILSKPCGLTLEEYENIKRHVVVGKDILVKSGGLQWLIPIVLHHHERWDGRGYPDRLKGEEIPLEARIVCLADAVEAMASDRPYRKALSFAQILQEVQRCSGAQFDPRVVQAFLEIAECKGESLLINIAEGETAPETLALPDLLEVRGWPVKR